MVHRPFSVSFAQFRGKDTIMKITMYYEDKNHPTTLEVPDEECSVMVETDYRQRLAEAEDKSQVSRRSVQEIMDEDFSKPTFNRNHAETRRHVLLSAYDPEGHSVEGMSDIQSELLDKDEHADLYHAIQKLRPKQRELLRKVFWENVKQTDIAREEGVGKSAISQRLRTICNRLRKFLS